MPDSRQARRRTRRRAARAPWLAALCLAAAGTAQADVVVLKDGRRVEGDVVLENAQAVRVRTPLGELEFPRADVAAIERGRTRQQELAEREKLCRTAGDFYELGRWAEEQRMRREAKRCMERAIALDKDHAAANEYLGRVQYKGEWMTPEERDARQRSDHEAEMRAQGLVQHGELWVTPADKRRLEQGLVEVDGRWLTVAEANRARGLEEYGGAWLPRAEVQARTDADRIGALLGRKLATALTPDALLCGPLAASELAFVGEGLVAGRDWFDRTFAAPRGLELFGGHLAQLYLWDQDSEPYVTSVPHFATWTRTAPEGWIEAAQAAHGFVFWDPFPVSSARQWNRNAEDLRGHCYHHWGHMLANRLGYDGRLLPPWYDEGLASLVEYRTHGRNRVFCRAVAEPGRGTAARRTGYDLDPGDLRRGMWRQILGGALEAGQVGSFDQLAQRELGQLDMVDILSGMAIVAWLEEQGGESLARFHAELRRSAPPVPERVILLGRDRQAAYDRAFGAATGRGWRDADQAWRAWFLNR